MKNNGDNKNTILLGNGFSQSLFMDVPQWDELFSNNHQKIKLDNNTLKYEAYLLRDQENDEKYKKIIVAGLVKPEMGYKKKSGVKKVNDFSRLLLEHHVKNILTTNYDTRLESIMSDDNGFIERRQSNEEKNQTETIYSIRRKKVFENEEGKAINIWKIHGDVDSIKSVMLGYDQYCGAVAKMNEYIKGQYRSSSGINCLVHMKDKITNSSYSDISWLDLFFGTNVYIAGLGMDFAEIDLWWLLNKRARFMKDKTISVTNNIFYLYSKYDETSNFEKKKSLLEIFGVKLIKMEPDEMFIPSLFDIIKSTS